MPKSNETLLVNEMFATLQGEGQSLGLPCMFLRLALCNLHCQWCDTCYTWNFGDSRATRYGLPTVRREDEVAKLTVLEVRTRLLSLAQLYLVISGGEPLLQQRALITLLNQMKGDLERIEIETAATLIPDDELTKLVSSYNCSPKLAHSGNSREKAYKPRAIEVLEAAGKAIWKFVIQSENDLEEVDSLVALHKLKRVYLMSEGRSEQELRERDKIAAPLAISRGYAFSPRLHIFLWGSKRGV